MPATAGRVRMPANNRVHSSAALQTHGIWQSAIGYDPYAPANKEAKPGKGSVPDSGSDNAYASFQGLLALARVTSGANSDETRGACRKCGRVGHLTYQCRNFLTLKEEDRDRNDDSALRTVKKIKNSVESDRCQEESGEEEEENSSSDSDVDPEIERIIAKRYGWKMSKKVSLDGKKRSRMKSRESLSSSDDEEERRKRRRRRQKRRNRDRQRESGSESSSESDRHRKRRRRRRREESLSGSERSESSESSSDEEEWREWKRRREEKKSRGRHLRQKD